MSNRIIPKIQINGKELREEIEKAGYSLRTLGHDIGYSDRQIRTYLKENQMTKDMYAAIIEKLCPKNQLSKKNKNLVQRLKAQIAVAKEVDGDFVYITVGDAKRILKMIEEEKQ